MPSSFDLAVTLQRETSRMKRRSKVIRRRQSYICKSHEPSQEIPFDLVIEILKRLPAKSLIRFKSVSKFWSTLICSQYFTNLSSSPRLYMWLGFDNEKILVSSSSSLDLDGSFVVDQDLTISAMKGYSVSHVYRGLMCFTNGTSAQIYNTTTRQLVVLPDLEESSTIARDHKFSKIIFIYHIAHDLVHDQYKVVCIVSRRKVRRRIVKLLLEHWVFTLGGGVSFQWRKIPCPCQPHSPCTRGLTINGRMYYLALVPNSIKPLFVRFDISSEKISVLQKPENAYWSRYYYTEIIEYDGRIAILDHADLVRNGVMELWVMEDEEKNRWSRKTLVLHPSQLNMIKTHIVQNMRLTVQGTTRNGDVVLAPQHIFRTGPDQLTVLTQVTTLFYVFLYNLQKNHLRKVEIKSNRYNTKRWDVIGFDDIENLMHL
ncbi:F-box/kelch-repeat protein [Raphanus sativus]|uniref:F-box/kelch-repeat protein At4g19930-like n=1 Tax=Raphanus sativus TaxID=3726 RepID=A0A6J0NCE0_RAPSA|nr:F-box/kelch-repeat protein At4g19930-like [Raphanus sativus]KAJ4899864.1 F-box/kelch-repeat protein [Raphanus sativus]